MRKNLGFTLIEIIIVIFIISIGMLAATLSIGNANGGREMRRQAEQLQRVLQLASQTAMIEQMDLSIGVWRTGYAVWRYNVKDKTWMIIQNERGFKITELPTPLQMSLRINNKTVILPANQAAVKMPQLWFSTTGEAIPAQITITAAEGLNASLVIKNNGEVTPLEQK